MIVLLCIGFYIVNDTVKSGGINNNVKLSLKSFKQKRIFFLGKFKCFEILSLLINVLINSLAKISC